jgi:hypothetical protein
LKLIRDNVNATRVIQRRWRYYNQYIRRPRMKREAEEAATDVI